MNQDATSPSEGRGSLPLHSRLKARVEYHTYRPDRRIVLFLLLAAICVTGWQAAVTHAFEPDAVCCDHLFYRSMAFNEFGVTRPDLDRPPPGNPLWAISQTGWHDLRNGLRRQPPFAFRIVTPLLARGLFSLTGNISQSFYIVTFLGLAGASLCLALAIYSLVGNLLVASLGLLVFGINPAIERENFWDYMITDPLAFFFASLALLALVRRKKAMFFVACAIGVFNKESMMPMLLAYPISEVMLEGRLRRDSGVAVAGIAVGWFAFRQLLPIPVDHYSFLAEFQGTVAQAKLVMLASLTAFGVLLVASWRMFIYRLGLAVMPFVLANVLAAFFVGNLERVMVQALPALLVGLLPLWPATRRGQVLMIAPLVLYCVEVGLNLGLMIPFHIVFPIVATVAIACEASLALAVFPGVRNRPVSLVA